MADNKDKDKTQQAIADAEAAARKAALEAANAEEAATLKAQHDAELSGLQAYNAAQYDNVGQIIGDIQSNINIAKAKDEAAQKRENAFRYISGLGDTLSSLANLVGVANKASNQQQTYNSHAVVQKAEEARKARKIEMDDLSKRLDEMTARQRDLKAAGSLKEAELKVKNAKEKLALESKHNSLAREEDKIAREERRKQEELDYRKERDKKQDEFDLAKLNIDQKQFAQSLALRTRELEATLADKSASKTYPMTIKGQKYEIPVRELNDAQVGNIFSKLPDDVKDAVKGEAYTEKIINSDGFEETQTKYKAPTLSQKIAAIAEYAEKTGDASIIAEVANLAGVALPKSVTQAGYAVSNTDESTAPNSGATKGKQSLSGGLYNIDNAPRAEAETLAFSKREAPEGLRVIDEEAERAIREKENAIIREQLAGAKGIVAPSGNKENNRRIKIDW